MQPSVTYPQYRKYANNKSFFKIISETEWEEIVVVAEKYVIHSFKANILPDRNFIYDMTFDYERNWLKIEEQEYNFYRRDAKAQSK